MSFSDSISTFRGLGTVGAILSLIVVGAFIVMGSLAFDKRFAGGEEKIEVQISKKEKALAALDERKQFFREKLSDYEELEKAAVELSALQVPLQKVKDSNSTAKSEMSSLKSEIFETQESFDEYKKEYRRQVREGAAGTKMEKLTTIEGETYHKVEIKTVGALGMSITHRDGSCRIPYDELPLAMQQQYQFDEEEAESQMRKEVDRRRQHQLALQATERAKNKQRQENELIKDKAEAAKVSKDIETLHAAITALEDRIAQAESRLSAESTKTISRAPAIRQEIEKLQSAKADYLLRLRRLEAAR